MQFQFAVRREKPGAAAGRTAADNVSFDQDHAAALLHKFRRRADATDTTADDQHIALQRFT